MLGRHVEWEEPQSHLETPRGQGFIVLPQTFLAFVKMKENMSERELPNRIAAMDHWRANPSTADWPG